MYDKQTNIFVIHKVGTNLSFFFGKCLVCPYLTMLFDKNFLIILSPFGRPYSAYIEEPSREG